MRALSVLAVLFIGVLVFLYWNPVGPGTSGGSQKTSIVQESNIPLLLWRDHAEQGAGYPPDTDWLVPHTPPDVSFDRDGIPILLPARGQLIYRDIPVHREAVLRFGYGVLRGIAPETPDFAITFRLRAGPREGLQEELFSTSVSDLDQIQDAQVNLPTEWVGGRIDLVFETESQHPIAQGAVLPAIASPVLQSTGIEVPLKDLGRVVTETLIDLIEQYPEAIEADDDWEYITHTPVEGLCFAVKTITNTGEKEILPIETSGVSISFEADNRYRATRGGAMPALFFDWEHDIVRYRINVPPGGARLEFSIAVDYRCVDVGSAEYEITIDGRSVFTEILDPGLRPSTRGWHACSVDLTAWAGQVIVLGFKGSVSMRGPQTLELLDYPPIGEPVPYSLEVKRVRGGFGRPRIVRDLLVEPRLSDERNRPSVVFVNVETFRADEPSCYGGIEGITPALDRMAAEGVRYASCVSSAPWTSPSVASVLTGKYPQSHGVTSYGRSFLFDSQDTLAERLSRAGVATAAFVSNELISEDKNFQQGFETFLLAPYANARQLVATFEDWLVDSKDLQFFAYLHLFEPHHPLNAPGDDLYRYVPDELRNLNADVELLRIQQALLEGRPVAMDDPGVRLLRGLYRGEIHYLDRQLGRLRDALERQGLLGRVIVVVTGDHGEEFLEHGLIGHGSHLYAESVLVPLVIWGPGLIPEGAVVDGVVENAALYATVLEAMGVEFEGAMVRPALAVGKDLPRDPAYSMTEQGIRRLLPPDIYTKTIHSLRTDNSSYVYSPPGDQEGEISLSELFDTGVDPGEVQSLSSSHRDLLSRMQALMKRAYDLAHQNRSLLEDADADARTRRAMNQLGYLGGEHTDSGELQFEEQKRR